jgi:hypothetical protein
MRKAGALKKQGKLRKNPFLGTEFAIIAKLFLLKKPLT